MKRKSHLRRRFRDQLANRGRERKSRSPPAPLSRSKIENENFNVLKNDGYNLVHNFGHGNRYLARMFATMNLLAFAFHTACDCLETLWQQAKPSACDAQRFLSGFPRHLLLRCLCLQLSFPPGSTSSRL
jgi:hypothetical protein